MIDVVFLLIAFFMTLMSFISAELIKLELLTAKKPPSPRIRVSGSISRLP